MTNSSILPDLKYVASGVGGKPTVQFSGINLQVINGSGTESTLNGMGNLILGYDPSPGTQTGSHNVLLGGLTNSYTSYGGIVGGGHDNRITAPYASILSGGQNTASGFASAITGGYFNKTTAPRRRPNGEVADSSQASPNELKKCPVTKPGCDWRLAAQQEGNAINALRRERFGVRR
jgi:hypothetical protein